ncbi:MAG: hypothetical protein IJ774_11455 [Selenomonadaceae bacterium]|nr:hypothetical protein [Selenomonadaceae bacterium]
MNKSNLADKVKKTLRDEKPAGGVKRLGDAKKDSSVRKVDVNGSKESGRKD